MDYENFELGMSILLGILVFVLLIYYYSSPQHSSCYYCTKTISHKKQNRFYVKISNENHAVCKACYNKKLKILSTPKVTCYCCSKSITPRMKAHTWVLNNRDVTLCSDCNRAGNRKLKHTIDIEDLISDRFLASCSNFNSHKVFFDSACLPLDSESDLDSTEWTHYISTHTRFSNWKEMKQEATNSLRDQRIRQIFAEITTPSSNTG